MGAKSAAPQHGAASVSVIVVSYNVRTLLQRCIASVEQQRSSIDKLEIIVVDNASTDGSADKVAAEYPHVRLLRQSSNMGFGAAINLGAKEAQGTHYLLLNPDAELQKNSLGMLLDYRWHWRQTGKQALGIVGPRQIDGMGRFQLAAWARPTMMTEICRWVAQRCVDRHYGLPVRLVEHWLTQWARVSWVSGSSLFVTREAFEAVGGFDEDYFLYFEDIDFCLRVMEAGFAIGYDPSTTVVHHRGASAKGQPDIAKGAYRKSQRRYWLKHGFPWERWVIEGYLAARDIGHRALR